MRAGWADAALIILAMLAIPISASWGDPATAGGPVPAPTSKVSIERLAPIDHPQPQVKFDSEKAVHAAQKRLGLAIQRVARFLQVHQMRGASDLHVTPHRRGMQCVKQPARVGVGRQTVPLAADDRHRCADQTGIVTEPSRPCVGDILPRPARRLHARWCA